MSKLQNLRYSFHSARSRYSLLRGDLGAARRSLDKAFEIEVDPIPHDLAHDGMVMIFEGRHREAPDRFRECLRLLPEQPDTDDEYVALVCKLQLAIVNANASYQELEALRRQAVEVDCSWSLKRMLRTPSEELLREVFGARDQKQSPFPTEHQSPKVSRVYYRSDI